MDNQVITSLDGRRMSPTPSSHTKIYKGFCYDHPDNPLEEDNPDFNGSSPFQTSGKLNCHHTLSSPRDGLAQTLLSSSQLTLPDSPNSLESDLGHLLVDAEKEDSVSSASNPYTSSSCSDISSPSNSLKQEPGAEQCRLPPPSLEPPQSSISISCSPMDECYPCFSRASIQSEGCYEVGLASEECYPPQALSHLAHSSVKKTTSSSLQIADRASSVPPTNHIPRLNAREPEFALLSFWPDPGCWISSEDVSGTAGQQAGEARKAETSSSAFSKPFA
jgi:hypothetical protein